MIRVPTSAGEITVHESGAGHPVVLLHGLLMDHTLWDPVLPLLPEGFRYLRPVLPLGAHPSPMRADADLSMSGMARVVAEILESLDLEGATLVHTDWGGGLFLTALGLDQRLGSMVVLSCEAFENFPPGLPGRMATLAARLPGGLTMAARQLRVGWLRRTPLLFGWMAKHGLSDEMARAWTAPLLSDRHVRRDLRAYATQRLDRLQLRSDTEALARFEGPVLVAWSREDKVMPREHGRRLAALIPRARLIEIEDAYVLSTLDHPPAVADAMTEFLEALPGS